MSDLLFSFLWDLDFCFQMDTRHIREISSEKNKSKTFQSCLFVLSENPFIYFSVCKSDCRIITQKLFFSFTTESFFYDYYLYKETNFLFRLKRNHFGDFESLKASSLATLPFHRVFGGCGVYQSE